MAIESDGALVVWTIYHRPADFPDIQFVVRGFEVHAGASRPFGQVVLTDTLPDARAAIPPSADVCLPRSLWDDPVVVESWI